MNVESVGEGQDVGVRSVCHLFWLINPELQSRFDQDIIVISGELLEEKKDGNQIHLSPCFLYVLSLFFGKWIKLRLE